MDRLQVLIDKQKDFQKLVGFPIDSVREIDRNEMSEKYIFKTIEELIELRKEFPSVVNPWSKQQKMSDGRRIREELADVLLFIVNFCIVWRLKPEDILERLEETQRHNFNGVKSKKMNHLNESILSIPSYTSGIGQGTLNPKYVFIGENPSMTIEHGYRFWSDPTDGSSKVLLPILENLGILHLCYFTNVVKSTTKKNEAPSQSVVDFWKDYLVKELDILKVNCPDIRFIVMGNDTEKMISDIPDLVKISHPASVLYGNITPAQYEEEIQKVI
jgi:uracil-DNA glycosylase family 4